MEKLMNGWSTLMNYIKKIYKNMNEKYQKENVI